jgi:hypothetical protein
METWDNEQEKAETTGTAEKRVELHSLGSTGSEQIKQAQFALFPQLHAPQINCDGATVNEIARD